MHDDSDDLPLDEVVARYAAGWFPMDDEDASGPLPWYAATERAVIELDDAARARLDARLRRSVRACAGHELRVDDAFADVLAECALPRGPGDGVWITERLARLYRRLHVAGIAHSYELWDGERLLAGVLAVRIGRAAMLESMMHRAAHAGNAVLARTLERLVAEGVVLCDIQLESEHTRRLGARLLSRPEYEARLRAALG